MTGPRLHQRFPSIAEALPWRSLHDGGPTPVREVEPGLWVKDDGAFGSGGWGGNKVRKLEWLLADRPRGILTFGGRGTNWGLATALYGREAGVKVALALVDQPVHEHVRAQAARLERSGAALHFTRSKRLTALALPWLLLRHRKPRVLPAGGSTAVGVLGYVEASLEIAEQVRAGELPEPATVVVAVGSGGTIAGLMLGLQVAGLRSRAVGVVVNDTLRLDHAKISSLAQGAARLLRKHGADLGMLELGEDAVTLTRDSLGKGYGHPTPEGAAAAAAHPDLRLDPVYTAKAMAAIRGMDLEGPVLFIHTDGPR